MKTEEILETASALIAGDKGILAMDESNTSLNARFKAMGLPETADCRRAYREMIVTTPGLGDHLSGAILYEETLRQTKEGGISTERGISTKEGISKEGGATTPGISFVDVLKEAGVIPGIRVDTGTVDLAGFPGEKITQGLDGLRERLAGYRDLGIRFANWKAVIGIGRDIPSTGCIYANMHGLARYAALCQEAGLLPIVESEVLMDGDHDIGRCFDVTEWALRVLTRALEEQRVDLHGILLKPNMILPGTGSSKKVTIEEVADATVECLLKNVPPMIPGVAFLAGAQLPELSTAHLNRMNLRRPLPWALSFCFSGAIQEPAMEKWKGREDNVKPAQQLLYRRIILNAMARRGEYEPAMENY